MSIDFQQALQLIQAIDQIRDSQTDDEDPGLMLEAITRLMVMQFDATGCGILLLSEDGAGIEHLAQTGLTEDRLRELGQQAMERDGWGPLSAKSDAIGAPMVLNGNRLGSVVLMRPAQSFNETEHSLLEFARTQIDSAIVQARTVWKIIQRNRELEAIHEIDHLRDYTSSEADLISGFTTVLLKYFAAELCMIILSHSDSGQMIVRGVVDKNTLPSAALDEIRQTVATIQQAQNLPSPPEFDQLQLLGAPLLVGGERLGGIVVGRTSGFQTSDHRLMTAMMRQMDSAIQHSRVQQQLAQRKRELEVIYRIDHMRDRESDFDSLLQQVLQELCNVIASELGYIMLYTDRDEEPLELKAATTDGLLTSPVFARVIEHYSRHALDSGQLIFDNKLEGEGLRSIVAVPLILNQRIIGVFGLINSHHSHGFNSEDRRLLSAITSQVDTAIFERLEQRRMRGLLSRSVDPKVLDYLLQQQEDTSHLLAGERVTISVPVC